MAEEDKVVDAAALAAEVASLKSRLAEVNNEAKGHRLNADKYRSEMDRAAAARDELAAEVKARQAEFEQAYAAKLASADKAMEAARAKSVQADLRVAAHMNGAADVDDVLALLPRDKLIIDGEGHVTNAAEIIADLKRTKPYLFRSPQTTTQPASPPEATRPTTKVALEMSAEEYKKARERVRRYGLG